MTQRSFDLAPNVFTLGECEYGLAVDTWLEHKVVDYTSETPVVALDMMWQIVIRTMCYATVYYHQHVPHSDKRIRPDYVIMHHNTFLIKGVAQADPRDYTEEYRLQDLINMLHSQAYTLFPEGCHCIPGIITSHTHASTRAIYDSRSYTSNSNTNSGLSELANVKNFTNTYNLDTPRDRVSFIVDILKLCVWIASQSHRKEPFYRHLVPGIRVKTRNGHLITWTRKGIYKEFGSQRAIPVVAINAIYGHCLLNVEHGLTNVSSDASTITRLGCRLQDALRTQLVTKQTALEQVRQGVEQLHGIGYAHCDICLDNIFVDRQGVVFIGDLEYCCPVTGPPPVGIKRGDAGAETAGQLDMLQLERFAGELAGA